MLLKYPNSNVDFVVTPAYFLGDFNVYDREETLGVRLDEFDPNNDEQLHVVLEEYFFNGARATGLTSEQKAELVRVLEDALGKANFDFDSLVAHERDPDDYFTLPYTWDIKYPKDFFKKVHSLATEFWRNELGEVGLNAKSSDDL